MASIYKRGGKGSYIVAWFDHTGRRREKSSGTTDHRAAKRLADKLEADAMLRREGIIDAAADKYAAANRKPLAEHLSDWHAALLAKDNTEKHVNLVVGRARRVLDGCGFTHWPDLSAAAVQVFIAELRDERKRCDDEPVERWNQMSFNGC